jgi:hypothetical protein
LNSGCKCCRMRVAGVRLPPSASAGIFFAPPPGDGTGWRRASAPLRDLPPAGERKGGACLAEVSGEESLQLTQ